ncbi:hypothetical protein K438DRAFT_2006810 [Mycena galopus ATCC 62051]|nr:hypothetical protein K438DRAFT_2006810 [Mycena galopus ATCC 62051]
MTETFSLEQLDEDILLRIFLFTDIYSILKLSQVNSFFHAIALTKQLWVLLLGDLILRGLIDVSSDDLSTLSTDELKAQVKHAVCGPRTWSPESPDAPTLIRQSTIALKDTHRVIDAFLFPGGHIIFQRAGVQAPDVGLLECYDVSRGRRVWTWAPAGFQIIKTKFSLCLGSKLTVSLVLFPSAATAPMSRRAAAEAASVTIANLVASERGDPIPVPNNIIHLLVLEVDLESGRSHEISQLQFSTAGMFINQDNMRFVEDYFGCILATRADPESRWLLLVNQRTDQYIAFKCSINPADLFIVSGHIFLLTTSESVSARLYSISSLQHLWRAISDFNVEKAPAESELIPTAMFSLGDSLPIDHDKPHYRLVRSYLTESVLRRNTYLLRVFDTVTYGRFQMKNTRMISTHRLDFSVFQMPQCIPLSTFTRSTDVSPLPVKRVSLAGYSVYSTSRVAIRILREEDGGEKFINFSAPAGTAFLQHNGALVVLQKTCAEILYYD